MCNFIGNFSLKQLHFFKIIDSPMTFIIKTDRRQHSTTDYNERKK